jgi:hydrogenase maturation protein HypF
VVRVDPIASPVGVVTERARIVVRGAVQGVGFRPFVFRLAQELGLAGWVQNAGHGVFIEVEGDRPALDAFLLRLEREGPPRAAITSLEVSFLDPAGYRDFVIAPSEAGGAVTALVLPDIATCAECLREIFDPADRRYRYPFTNCTNCGPRYSIIEALPYDRPHTSMKAFAMCAECRREYADPRDRRFHAQPNACPACGPALELWDDSGAVLARADAALRAAVAAIAEGRIVAMKGIGGFLLLADALREEVVRRLRARKRREEKPFALLYPSLEAVAADCEVSPLEARLLRSPEAPIVLLRRRAGAARIAPAVAPGNPYLGVMLPYSPLHHLLARDLGQPVVATSGNVSDEPLCTDEHEALARLRGIADLWLVHNRPIVRHVDDSIVRVVRGRELVLRRARGYAPLPVPLRAPVSPLLAVGAHLKNTVALAVDRHVFVSQHIGDLETAQAVTAFRRVIASLTELYRASPGRVAADLHPDYVSTQHARTLGVPVVFVQHHVAHVLACLADNDLEGPVLGVAWDGTGYGLDGTVWGGEFLVADTRSARRVASFRSFRLPGGERAIREPRRTALGVLYEVWGARAADAVDLPPIAAFAPHERTVLVQMLERRVNAPLTSSAGRLFDAVAALLGLCQRASFEGQAAMAVEFAVDEREPRPARYPFRVQAASSGAGATAAVGPERPAFLVDWQPLVEAVVDEVRAGADTGRIAARLHHTLAAIIVDVARRVGLERVVLTGGCFQNRYLTECTIDALASAGFKPYWHQRVPPNDGGIAVGQVIFAAAGGSQGAGRCVWRFRDGS